MSRGSQCESEHASYDDARNAMVHEQIERRGLNDPELLECMRKVDRCQFVPGASREAAYEDRPLPIGEGQTISQPFIVALMTSKLDVHPQDRVLEIGTGSGYQAAVLAELVSEVYTIEIVEPLARAAEERLRRLGYDNVWVKCGDGVYGWEEYAPFEAIMVTCASPRVPTCLVEQIAEGGRIIVPLGDDPFLQSLTLLKKQGGKMNKKNVASVIFVPMTGAINKAAR